MWLKIKPLDVLLFRTSRPFGAGESFRAESIFPPTSIPFIGAIRSRAICHLMDTEPDPNAPYWQYDVKIKNKLPYHIIDHIGTPDDLGPLSFEGPYLSMENTICLTLPKDLMQSNKSLQFLSCLQPGEASWPVISSTPGSSESNLDMVLEVSVPESEACESGYLIKDHLVDYLLNDLKHDVVFQETLCEPEHRLGIALNANRFAQTGLIYNVMFNRLTENSFFLIKLTSQENNADQLLPDQGFLGLGGESRAAYFEKIQDTQIPASLTQSSQTHITEKLVQAMIGKDVFKVYLISPALFDQGWLPDYVDPITYEWQILPDVTITLKAAAVGKYISISGWNLVKQMPRPMLRAVPSGSVYYFQSRTPFTEQVAREILEKIHFKSMMKKTPRIQSDFYRSAGFGLAAVGLWK
jgi:CRISPR-associated protein Cmr3